MREGLLGPISLRSDEEASITTTDVDLRRTRAAKNQSIFRAVNQRIEEISEGFDLAAEMLDFVRECMHESCHERLKLTRGEYEAVRRVPTHLALKPGHEIAGRGDIVESNDRFIVVAKLGVAGQTAMKLDPRSRD